MTLFGKYRKMVEQGFVPIFAAVDFDTEILLEGCRRAGVSVLEYTLRRQDANRVLPDLKKRFPDAVVMVGSTIDDDQIVKQIRARYPQLLTVSELAPMVDGFVSMLPYSNETLQRYRKTHLLIPTAETGGEALRQMKNGATAIKVCGPDFSFAKKLHATPTFDYCPTFLTGGVRLERVAEALDTGAILCAAGFDVILSGLDAKTLTAEQVEERLRAYVEAAKRERGARIPALANCEKLSDEEFRAALPNYCSIV